MHKHSVRKAGGRICAVGTALAIAATPLLAHAKRARGTHPAAASAQAAKTIGERIVEAAKKYSGMPYVDEGRNTRRLPGLDCLGLMFLAHGAVSGRNWRSYSVMPSELMPQLGQAVEAGKSAVVATVKGWNGGKPIDNVARLSSSHEKSGAYDATGMIPGDFVFFLAANSTSDVPVARWRGHDLWVAHTAIYAGDGMMIHADFESMRVTETSLSAFFEKYADAFIVVRPGKS